MSERFGRLGVDYRFAPAEVPVVLLFQRCRDKDESFTCQVAVRTSTGAPVMTRRVDLLAGLNAGALSNLAKELNSLNHATGLDEWRALLREGAERVIYTHRQGRPFMHTRGEIERPPPPSWLCQGLLLKHRPNCWLGAASTGKSTLAKAMCAYYASGYRFCDRDMEQGVPLYLDWEDDYESFNRVVFDICRNLGVWPLPHMIWRDMHGGRLRDQLEVLARVIDEEQVGLLVLDAVAAAGGSTGEHMTWEAIALEMEDCLGVLPPVTVLALDHVTGAEHRAQRNGSSVKPPVPVKARGAERKLEYTRNQWSLVTDVEAEGLGRHVVEWTHTKLNAGPKERFGFATEIIHRPDELSIMLRPLAQDEPEPDVEPSLTQRLLAELALVHPQTVRELAWRIDGHPPDGKRHDNVRRMLDRQVTQGVLCKAGKGANARYWPSGQLSDTDGLVIPFRGA